MTEVEWATLPPPPVLLASLYTRLELLFFSLGNPVRSLPIDIQLRTVTAYQSYDVGYCRALPAFVVC